jgi:ferredoxin-like protein FixX
LDRWTKRVVDVIADELGAEPLYPFGGQPWHPFQRWAQRAEPVLPSPIAVLIHPDDGLWHAYRAALCFAERLELPALPVRPRPCDSCARQPCLSACPVSAFTVRGFDVAACASHVKSSEGQECRERGCLARRACPIGRSHAYPADQMAFHMAAFLAAR